MPDIAESCLSGIKWNIAAILKPHPLSGLLCGSVRSVHRVLEHRYHGKTWPATKLETTQLLSWLLKRVNEASGPYQMFGVLADVILLRGWGRDLTIPCLHVDNICCQIELFILKLLSWHRMLLSGLSLCVGGLYLNKLHSVYVPPLSSYCEYLEEFPIQALAQFTNLSGHQVTEQGLLVLIMQYGLNRTDTLGPGRAESEWTRAWKSNFLHPVLYYYSTLPTGEQPCWYSASRWGWSEKRYGFISVRQEMLHCPRKDQWFSCAEPY